MCDSRDAQCDEYVRPVLIVFLIVNEVSVEAVVALNPAYIFVMDRDSAIGSNGAQLAREIMENERIMKTDAYKNGNLIILDNPGIWYLAEGGITALGIMLDINCANPRFLTYERVSLPRCFRRSIIDEIRKAEGYG